MISQYVESEVFFFSNNLIRHTPQQSKRKKTYIILHDNLNLPIKTNLIFILLQHGLSENIKSVKTTEEGLSEKVKSVKTTEETFVTQ